MTLHLGTSGWAYPEWRPDFYPQNLRRDDYLAHYASVFDACEINATFYSLQSPATVERWASQVPAGFRFVAKAHRRLTHTARLGDRAFMAEFVASLAPLGGRLGTILLQLPETKPRDDRGLAALMASVPSDLPFAMEFRHGSWADDDVTDAVVAAGGTICVTDAGGPVPDSLPPGRIAYVRLRSDHYDAATRARWLELLTAEGAERDVFAFARHKGVPAGDEHAGVTMAAWMATHR